METTQMKNMNAKFHNYGPRGERDYEDGGNDNLGPTEEQLLINNRDKARAAALVIEIEKVEAAIGRKLDRKNRGDQVSIEACRKNVAWRIK